MIALATLLLSFAPGNLGSLQSVHSASAASDPVVAAAGDIACDPTDPSFAHGIGTATACRQLYTSNLLLNGNYAAVLPLGDNQYYCGQYQAFLDSYGPTWGRLKAISHPVAGNHDYGCSRSAAGYFEYFGSKAGPPGEGYYSYDIGLWHLIALNSQCASVGGCGIGSPQYKWLQSDLEENANHCTLAYWHIPLFASSMLRSSETQPLWQLLYQSQADVILNGHSHTYERFAPQDPSGKLDAAGGIREFVVGTGGANHTGFAPVAANSLVRNATTFGVLALTLHPAGYDWRFIPESGGFTDSGSASCHNPALLLPTPQHLTANNVTDEQVGLNWTASSGTVSVSGYHVFRNGEQIASVRYPAYIDTRVNAQTNYTYFVEACNSAGLISHPSNAVNLTTPPPAQPRFVFSDGFESGSLAKWNITSGLDLESHLVRSGHFAVIARSSDGTRAFARVRLPLPQTDLYYHVAFNATSLGNRDVNLMQFFSSAGRPVLTVRISASRRIMYFNNVTGQVYKSNTTVSMGGWHNLKAHLHIGGAAGQVQIWYDASPLITLSHADNFGANGISQLQFGEWRPGLTYNIAFDNIWAYILVWPAAMVPVPASESAVALVLPYQAPAGSVQNPPALPVSRTGLLQRVAAHQLGPPF